jgi:hypothetical protein
LIPTGNPAIEKGKRFLKFVQEIDGVHIHAGVYVMQMSVRNM